MLADFYITRRLNDMKNHLAGQILSRSLDPKKHRHTIIWEILKQIPIGNFQEFTEFSP